MKKSNIINLIKFYAEKNDIAFRSEAYVIAENFRKSGDTDLEEYIYSLLQNRDTIVPQMLTKKFEFLSQLVLDINGDPLPIPNDIQTDILGIINAASKNIGVNKFLFIGNPGTGKTETAKQIARILNRELYVVDFAAIVDSKLGQTGKNISTLFAEVNNLNPERSLVLFDEIDVIALDRTNSQDLREMGRATTYVLKGLENINNKLVLIATTNLFQQFDKALTRRFDAKIDFNRYTREDLIDVAVVILEHYLSFPQFQNVIHNIRLFKKIINQLDNIPYPGTLKNLIKASLAFSDPNDGQDYLRKIYTNLLSENIPSLQTLQDKGFTIREIEVLTGNSRSKISRELKGE